MKTYIKLLMILFLAAVLLPVSLASAQEFMQDQKLTRKEKKEMRKAQLYANFLAIDTLLQRRTFVLEADFLQNRYGDQAPVSSTINFIRVEGENVVLQTGSNFAYGYNGVGGVTAEGLITNWKVTRDEKHLGHTVRFTTTTNIGTYDILMRISADANTMATITGLTMGSLTYRGDLVALYNSRIFKGQRTL